MGSAWRKPQFSYTHSSFRDNIAGGLGDQDLLPLSPDFNHPTAFFGSASQDRKNLFAAEARFWRFRTAFGYRPDCPTSHRLRRRRFLSLPVAASQGRFFGAM